MRPTNERFVESLPDEAELRDRLGDVLREADLIRQLIRVVRRRDEFRAADRLRLQTSGEHVTG
jgi:hypothetical protein